MEDVGQPTEQAFVTVVDATSNTGTIYSDITGRFPPQSSQGHRYVFLLYDCDSNAIMVEPLKSRATTEILRAFTTIQQRLRQAGRRPQLHILDNECSAILKQYMHQHHIPFQLEPPYTHRRNAAEHAIRTFKDHFITGLASAHKQFPLHLWDRLLPQAELTLNLLRPSRINLKLSANMRLKDVFNFDVMPLAPPSTKVLIHDKASMRASCAPHGSLGWYVSPAL